MFAPGFFLHKVGPISTQGAPLLWFLLLLVQSFGLRALNAVAHLAFHTPVQGLWLTAGLSSIAGTCLSSQDQIGVLRAQSIVFVEQGSASTASAVLTSLCYRSVIILTSAGKGFGSSCSFGHRKGRAANSFYSIPPANNVSEAGFQARQQIPGHTLHTPGRATQKSRKQSSSDSACFDCLACILQWDSPRWPPCGTTGTAVKDVNRQATSS